MTRGVVTRGVMSEFSVTFLVLVNSKSGGQDGPHLLEKFTEIFREVSSFTPTDTWEVLYIQIHTSLVDKA